jgi:TonB-dependent starch-binding outer membrane protein SusC
LNATIPRNKLVYFKDFENSTYASDYVIGKPVNILKVYDFAGVDAELGTYVFRKKDGTLTDFPDYFTDRTRIVDPNPKWYGGISNSIQYKSFTLDFLLQYVNKEALNERFRNAGLINNNVSSYVFENRWRQKSDITDVQQFHSGFLFQQDNAEASNAKFSDASFLRLKNASLSYTFPSKIISKAGMTSARMYIQGQNLFTVTNYLGLDPETAVFNRLPSLKMYTVGLQVTF